MTTGKAQVLTNVQDSIKSVISAHKAILEGIATHAQKRREIQDSSRRDAKQRALAAEGASKQNAQIRAAS